MNCDRIAPLYQWFEKAAFGGTLQRHRLTYLDEARNKQRALVLGDGDGRFLQQLTTRFPNLKVDCVDISAGMLTQLRKRVTSPNVRIAHADALEETFPAATYDIIYTHFFLDCFDTCQVTQLTNHLLTAFTQDAVWVISDFRQADAGWRKYCSSAWLSVMYLFFHLATGLNTRALPDHQTALASAGFQKLQERTSMAGLVVSELWLRR